MVDWSNITTATRDRAMDTTLAYLAGVIDSDGTIGIKRSTYAMRVRKDAGAPMYSERIAVKQVTPEAIDLLKLTFGGYRFVTKSSLKNGRLLHGWQVTDLAAAKCLTAIRPFLRIKTAQADNCLALRSVKDRSRAERTPFGRGHVGGIARSEGASAEMEGLYVLAHELNAVGLKLGV